MRRLSLASILALMVLFAAPSLPAQAFEREPPRVSAQAHYGLNMGFLPYLGGEVAYRTPLLDDHVGLVVDYSPVNITLADGFSTIELGARYYFGHRQDSWQPYAVASVGSAWGTRTIPGRSEHFEFGFANLGVGADWMFWENLGLSMQACASYPFLFRGEAGLRLAF